MNGQLAQDLTIELDMLLLECLHEARVLNTAFCSRRTQARNPESTKRSFLETTISVGILPRFDDGLLRLLESRMPHAAVALRQSADLRMPAVPDGAALDAHIRGRERGIVKICTRSYRRS